MKRSAGRSAVAAAAYRAGEKLRNEFEGGHSDFSRRDGVLHTEILAPDGAAGWVYDREELWNKVEASEKHPRAQLAREVELALPHQLSQEQNLALLRQYVKEQFVSRGMIADVAVHEGHTDERNVHAHVLLTMRELRPDGFGNKVREWNELKNVLQWREAWASYQNTALQQAGHAVKVDHRSYRQRGDKRTAQIHEGPKGRRMKDRNYRPRSKSVQRRTWNNRPRKRTDYRQIDRGRSRAQRNFEIRWRNYVRSTSGERLSQAVETHIHRRHYGDTLQAAREAGKRLRAAGKWAKQAQSLERRSAQIIQLHRRKLTELAQLQLQIGRSSRVLDDHVDYRLTKLAEARSRYARRRRQVREARQRVRRAAVQYRNIRSQLGGPSRAEIRRQIQAAHSRSIKAVTQHDIWRSPLTDTQKRELSRAWDRERERSRAEDRWEH